MSKKRATVRSLSEEAKANIREGAAKRTAKAASANKAAITAAMTQIETEVLDNEGLYPHPTKLNLSEVARRASVTLTVLYKEPYKELVTELRTRLDKLHKPQPPLKEEQQDKQSSPRRSLKERVQDWSELYNQLKDVHIKTELDLLGANDEIASLRKEVDELRGQLRRQAEFRVVSMSKSD